MRTIEERTKRIHERTAELKREKQKKQQRMIEVTSIAACLLVLVGVSGCMPEWVSSMSEISISHISGAASILGDHEQLGYIVIAVLAFLLGVSMTVFLYRLRQRNEHSQREDDKDEF